MTKTATDLRQYQYLIDGDREGSAFTTSYDISDYVETADWSAGMAKPWQRVANPATMRLVINNASGKFTLHDSNAEFASIIKKGTLVRVQVLYEGAYTPLSTLRIARFEHQPFGGNPVGRVLILCSDMMPELLAADYSLPLMENVTVDQVLDKVFEEAAIVYPNVAKYFYIGTDTIGGSKLIYDAGALGLTDFEAAEASMEFVGDNVGSGEVTTAQDVIRDVVKAEITGMFYFNPRNQLWRFLNRYYAQYRSLSELTTNDSALRLEQKHIRNMTQVYGADVINEFTLQYEPREVGTAGSVIYQSDSVPFSLPAQSYKTIRIKYKDPDNPDASIGAKRVIQPKAGVDVIGNRDEDGSGDNWTQYIKTAIKARADGAEITLYADKVGDPIWIQTLQVRGQPLLRYQPEEVTSRDGLSVYNNDVYAQRERCRSINDTEQAQQFADFIINSFATPSRKIVDVSMVVKDDSITTSLFGRTMGDVITVVDEQNTDADYMIVGESHRVEARTLLHEVTWTLRPKDTATPFVIGTSEIGGPDLILI